MRAVFVNHCHPDTPHVCAVRLREFANALAKQGHRIVLLTATLGPDDRVLTPVEVGAALETHDWSRPFLIACRPAPAPLTEALQEHDLMPGIRQMVVLWCFLAKGGVFWNWTAASEPLWPVLAESFRPDAVWATLGNLDALNIARGIAGIAGCPWVMDIKDPWRNAIPRALRAVIAGRYRDAAAITGIFDAHIAMSKAGSHKPRPSFTVDFRHGLSWIGMPPRGMTTFASCCAAASMTAAISKPSSER